MTASRLRSTGNRIDEIRYEEGKRKIADLLSDETKEKLPARIKGPERKEDRRRLEEKACDVLNEGVNKYVSSGV